MDLYSFTFFVTEDCNFSCSYCYQKKRKKYIKAATIEKAVDYFFPLLTEDCYINFYGGEPLLAFDKIRHAVDYIQEKNRGKKKRIQYSITTNGSLIDDNILEFLNQYSFLLLLSFDGIVQDKSRQKGSFKEIIRVIKKIFDKPDIDLETNSVFTHETVGNLSKSIQSITELGVPNISISPCNVSRWDHSSLTNLEEEFDSLREFMLCFYQKEKRVPLVNFRKKQTRGIFSCYAGKDRLAITPDGKLWGCYLFADYFRDKEATQEYHNYCFGDLRSFITNNERIYPQVLSNYADLRMNRFFTSQTPCNQCDEIEECDVCPAGNMFSGSEIREVPSWNCKIKQIFRKERKRFWEELKNQKFP